MSMSERDARISAAGVAQSVIASGAKPEEWASKTLYGLRIVAFAAKRLQGQKADAPPVPKSLKGESTHG